MSQAGIVDIIGTHPEIPTLFVCNVGSAVPIANTLEILGQAVAAHSVPIQTVGSGNTVEIDVQYSSAAASSVANNAGVASFNSAQFTVDANGFVALNGSGALQTLSDDVNTTITPSAGNIQLVGHVVEQGATKFSTVVAGTHIANINPMSPARWIVDPLGFNGTHTTIGSALTSATSGDTIFILPGTYTENLTLKAGVNITAFQCDAIDVQVTISGKCTFTGSGSIAITGVNLQTNSDFFLSITGSNSSVVNLINCSLNCTNNTGINFTSSNSSSVISIINSFANLATTGIALYSMSSAGTINFLWSQCNNTGSSTTASSNSAGLVDTFYSNFNIPFSTSSTGKIGMTETFVDTHAINTTCVTTAGTATHTLQHCSFAAGTASALSAGSGTTINTNAIIIDSSNTNVVTGLGTVAYSIIEQGGSPGAINASVNTGEVSNTGPLRSQSISFDNGSNLLNAYTTSTWTPAINFGGGTTGITYSVQNGKYWKIGSIVFIEANITLTNKGSSTGNANLSGLPFTSRSGEIATMTCLSGNITFTGISPMILLISSAATTGAFFQGNQGSDIAAMQNTAFSNTSNIYFSGFYFTS